MTLGSAHPDAIFGFAEALRIVLVALAALNIGTLAGRIRHYLFARRALREVGRRADADTAGSVVTFFIGYLIILASMAWRIAQLYHSPASVPLALLAVGLLISLLGLRAMAHHVTPVIISPDSQDLLAKRRRKD